MILYISGSFPRLGDGIGDAAGKLYDSMKDKADIWLVTSDYPQIRTYIKEQKYENVQLVSNWRSRTIWNLLRIAHQKNISQVLIEYCGNGYGKALSISFLPFGIRLHNLFSKHKLECHLRLHEYTMCRPARKLFTRPLVRFCHHMDTPSYTEYEYLKKKFGNKVVLSGIGSNVNWANEKKPLHLERKEIYLGFFGGIYPGKGIERLLDLWSRLEQQYPGKFRYFLLGGFPESLHHAFKDYQKSIKKRIDESHLTDKITITGFLPAQELEQALDRIDIAVLPYEDGLTLRRGSFLAFLCRNTAIVTSQGDMAAEQIFAGAPGVKMCKNEEEMFSKILEYSENRRYYEAGFSNNQFRTYFDWDRIADKVLNCFTNT